MVSWIVEEFKPLTLISPTNTLLQQVDNAVRYWNTHSAFKISGVYDYAAGTKRVQIDPEFKSVVDVIPTQATTWIWNDHPLWTLTGITVLDNVTTDLIMMSEAFRNYRIYVGTNFRFHWQKSDDPTTGGYVYAINVPNNVSSLFVIGTKRILSNENVTNEYILDWVLYYAKALVKQIEGNTLRKTAIIDTPIDGQAMIDEGREEVKDLQARLARDCRWVIMMKRK